MVNANDLIRGVYRTIQVDAGAVDLTDATEYEVATVATYIVNSTANTVRNFSYIAADILCFDTGQAQLLEFALYKCKTGDANIDFANEETYGALTKESKLFKRGLVWSPGVTYGQPGHIRFKLFNVKLEYDEELRLLINPHYVGAAAWFMGRLEWRVVSLA